ncbi:MAG: DUF2029 domain-containing protein [Anaerolineales bacterium]|nr:DUF2029 domain-containing protein [Anaerolineales bacterium]
MAAKKIGRGLTITGIAGTALSLIAAIVFNDRPGIPSIPILAIEVSVILVLSGIWLVRRETIDEIQPGKQIHRLISQILDFPIITWVLIGFLFVYLLLFLSPVFLNSNLEMNYFTRYIPNLNPIGNDLRVKIDLLRGLLVENQSPYTIGFYPPLTYALFAPLLLIEDDATLYRLFTLFTFFNYCLLTLLLPLKMIARKHFPLALLLFITGLFSYGFQFELERGQYNAFTFLLCMTSIYIFHYHRKHRLLAYLLFSLSVQLKLYPAIFIVMFVDDWRDWKNVIVRFTGIGLFNLGLFFLMGYQVFLDFFRSVTTQIVNPSWIGPWNHSISSFISVAKQDGLGLLSLDTLRTFRHNAEWVEVILILTFILLFASALLIFHLRKETGLDPYLLLTCMIGALILPISYDYTLSLLPVPMLLFLCSIPEMNNPWHRLISILLTVGISITYFSTLIPYNYRPHFLNNLFPALFLILITVTILNFMRYKNGNGHPVAAESASQTAA